MAKIDVNKIKIEDEKTRQKFYAQEALRESEEKYRILFESSSDAIMLLDEKGFFDCNQATLKIFGIAKKEDFVKMHPSDLSPKFQPDGKNSLEDANQKIADAYKNGSNHFEWVHRKVDGEDFFADVLLTAFGYNGKRVLQATVRDITKIRRIGAEYRMILQTSLDGFYAVGMNGNILDVNDSYCAMIGYAREELLRMSVKDLDVVDTEKEIAERIRRIVRIGGERFETKHKRKDGKIIEIEASVKYAKEEGGKFFVFIRDITEQKKLEEEMIKFKLGIDWSGDAIFITDTKGTMIYVNPAFEKIYGFKMKEVLGKTPRIIKSGLISEEGYERFWKMLLEKKTVSGEIINKMKNNKLVAIEGSNNPIIDASGKIIGFLGVHRDITERKKKEEELREKTRELEEKNKIMEIKEREIKNALENSERANKLMVGRELKMVELKKEIAELKNKLQLK